MKKNIQICTLIALITLISIFSQIKAYAQNLDFNTDQTLTVSGPGFFQFATTANSDFHMIFPTNPTLDVSISNYLGGPCLLAPAADFAEIGPQTTLNGNQQLILDFNMAGQNIDLFGLSFSPVSAPCTFNVFITPHELVSSSSSSSSGSVSTETLFPNSLTVLGTYINNTDLLNQLSNGPNNPQCQNNQSGINGTLLQDPFILDSLFGSLNLSSGNSFPTPRIVEGNVKARAFFMNEEIAFTFPFSNKKKKENIVFDIELENITDTTQIYVTGVFPSVAEANTAMLGSRLENSEIEVTLKNQDLTALAAVQHAIVSATMPWQLSPNGGFFITQGGGCVGPFCTIVEAGMVVIDPDGACTPDKLNKRKAGYPTVNPSKLFDPFPNAAKVIQLPTDSLIAPNHPLVSKIARDNSYLILQPVPPKAKIVQQVKLKVTKDKQN